MKSNASHEDVKEIQNRLRDLADRSYNQNVFTFSPFLSLSEADAYYSLEKELHYASPSVFGGYENAERCMIRFGDPESLGYEQSFPIVCIHITPLMEKFADKLSHRDFLGALMNLGIERDVLGDIKAGEKEAFLFCLDSIADFKRKMRYHNRGEGVSRGRAGRGNNTGIICESRRDRLKGLQAFKRRFT